MKTIVEYGVRGGACAETIMPSAKQGEKLAKDLIWVLANPGWVFTSGAWVPTNTPTNARYLNEPWRLTKACPRFTWQSETHYVALSLLDDVPRGPAAPELSKLP